MLLWFHVRVPPEYLHGTQSDAAEDGLDSVFSYNPGLQVREGMQTLFHLIGCSLDTVPGAITARSPACSADLSSSASFFASFTAL